MGRVALNWCGDWTMAIPDYQTVMLPLLSFVARKGESSTSEAVAALRTPTEPNRRSRAAHQGAR